MADGGGARKAAQKNRNSSQAGAYWKGTPFGTFKTVGIRDGAGPEEGKRMWFAHLRQLDRIKPLPRSGH